MRRSSSGASTGSSRLPTFSRKGWFALRAAAIGDMHRYRMAAKVHERGTSWVTIGKLVWGGSWAYCPLHGCKMRRFGAWRDAAARSPSVGGLRVSWARLLPDMVILGFAAPGVLSRQHDLRHLARAQGDVMTLGSRAGGPRAAGLFLFTASRSCHEPGQARLTGGY